MWTKWKKENVRHIEVEYPDGRHAFIDDHLLESLIISKEIIRLFRPSEKRWIAIGMDRVRSWNGNYCGMERRRTGRTEEMIPLRERREHAACLSR
jgi:hypothetical protein